MDSVIKRVVKQLLAGIMELGPVKAAFSRKATITLAAVGAVYAWTKEAMAEGWPPWVIGLGMIAVAILGSAFVLGQAHVDKETEKQDGEMMRSLRPGERGFVHAAFNYQLAFWSLAAGVLGLALILAVSACRTEANDDDDVVVDFQVTVYDDAILCLADSLTQVPQLWGIWQVPEVGQTLYFDTEVRVVGNLCTPVTEVQVRTMNGVETLVEVTVGEHCLRQVLDLKPATDTDCLFVTQGAQGDIDLFVYPRLWYPLEMKGEVFAPASVRANNYSLVRNEASSLIGDDQKVYPNCAPAGVSCAAELATCVSFIGYCVGQRDCTNNPDCSPGLECPVSIDECLMTLASCVDLSDCCADATTRQYQESHDTCLQVSEGVPL